MIFLSSRLPVNLSGQIRTPPEPEQQGAEDGQETQAEPSAGGAEDDPPRRAPARLIEEEERREETIGALDERRDAAPPPDEHAPALAAPAAPAPEGLTGTAMALDLPAEVWREAGKLPFKPASPGQPASGQDTAKTLQMPVMRDLGDTVPVGDDSIMKAVAALPFAGSTVGAAIVPFPRLKLEEYTSLCAELSVRPELSAEILRRYQVLSKAAHGALDEHWQEHFAAHPEARAAFERGLAQYTAWLRMQRR
jgi:hypothetical protein